MAPQAEVDRSSPAAVESLAFAVSATAQCGNMQDAAASFVLPVDSVPGGAAGAARSYWHESPTAPVPNVLTALVRPPLLDVEPQVAQWQQAADALKILPAVVVNGLELAVYHVRQVLCAAAHIPVATPHSQLIVLQRAPPLCLVLLKQL